MEYLEFMSQQIPHIISFGIRVLLALVFFFVGRILINWCQKLVRRHMKRTNVDQGVCQFVSSVLKVALYILLIILIATNLGVDSSSAATLLASAGVAIGLALQGSLSNFAGGVLILVLKPFVVGDYIVVHSTNNEGTVKEVQMFFTKLSTVDNRTIVIPNGVLSNSSITNVTDRPERQLDLRVNVPYQADLKKTKQLLEELLQQTPEIIQQEGTNVFIDELGEKAVVIGLRAWVKTEEYGRTRCRLLEEIKLLFDRENV